MSWASNIMLALGTKIIKIDSCDDTRCQIHASLTRCGRDGGMFVWLIHHKSYLSEIFAGGIWDTCFPCKCGYSMCRCSWWEVFASGLNWKPYDRLHFAFSEVTLEASRRDHNRCPRLPTFFDKFIRLMESKHTEHMPMNVHTLKKHTWHPFRVQDLIVNTWAKHCEYYYWQRTHKHANSTRSEGYLVQLSSSTVILHTCWWLDPRN